MSIDADHLLKRLRPAAPVSPPARAGTRSTTGTEGAFARLIRLAESDGLESGRPMSGAGLEELDPDQRRRIARACDSLEAAGHRDGLVLLGGRAFVVATAERTVQRELGSGDLGEVHALGGIVMVEPPDLDHDPSAPVEARVPRLPANTALHPALHPGGFARREAP
ncbi:MAG: hypothetical protein VX684_06110 [Planctomycetota bacterium]|nr:hypothetical protein [Planctomycetota bacterium]MEC8733954.1 hypothetical protein [Planctomycetota bacterium]MEC9158716.1 hypothetical protein [Planctomycetota bacterium]MED5507395.1 hypothetical protein [Planctomycetota bacterium]MED6308254.1 hypothetical protein [Planctomycetota bacterium]